LKQLITLPNKLKLKVQQVWANLANIVKSGYRSNAFAPLVWFNAIVNSFLLIGICYTNEIIVKYIFTICLGIILIFTLVMYLALFIKDPKLLQSERFRLEDKKLDMISQKGSDIVIQPVDLTTPYKLEDGND
jgi:hypothetical protein